MYNVVTLPRPARVVAERSDIVEQLARAAFNEGIDPSDEHEFIFGFLYSLNFAHWTVISECFEDVMYELGQKYIAREIERA